MHAHDLRPFEHSHAFGDGGADARSRALLAVTWLTLGTMAVELAAGWWSGSLALLADGWHMGTHAAALGGAALAAHLARRAHGHADFAFGGWKIEVLAGYTSGLALLGASVWIAVDAIGHLAAPPPVAYREALVVAVIGLVINLLSAWLLSRGARHVDDGPHDDKHDHAHQPTHDHAHEASPATRHGHDLGRAHRHEHGHGHGHGHLHGHGHAHDHNFHAAYLHVMADALTSVLAIGALAGGWLGGWRWLDPAVALLAAVVIGRWSLDVLRVSARGLVDATADDPLRQRVRGALEVDGDARVADLHVWQVGPRAWSVAASLVADHPLEPSVYRDRLAPMGELRHVTVEVHRCRGAAP